MLLPLSRMPELSPNRQAFSVVQDMISRSARLRIEVSEQSGATVIDCGIHAEGGVEAGIYFSKVCLGGLAQVSLKWQDINGLHWQSAEVVTDHPVRACMASQYASWPINCRGRIYMGSGPACAVVHRGSLFQMLGYEDDSEIAILCLECAKLPSDGVISQVLDACPCVPGNLYILAAPTYSLAGTVQVAARALETGLFKLRRLGYDLGKVRSGTGVCPVSPPACDTISGLGRTNDAISYGAEVLLYVCDSDEAIRQVIGRVPACAAAGYGRAFMELGKVSDNFWNRGPDQFNPAVITICNLMSGNSFTAGELRPDVLRRSFGLT